MVKKITIILLILAIPLWAAVGWLLNDYWHSNQEEIEQVLPVTDNIIPRPLEKYSIESMRESEIPAGDFKIVGELSEEEDFISYKFEFDYSPTLDEDETKTTTGLINLPKDNNNTPIVLMLRGWAPLETYTHGVGTWKASEVFAQNGYITVAPDFLGYADSDENAADIFESRFQTYTTVLTLLESLDQIKEWDQKNVFIWAHSNGGQIALTTLTVTDYPTTLWAPVNVFFPYSVLYYTNESTDKGKFIRKELAEFEQLYDVNKFSYDNYLENIESPLQVHQGAADEAIPLSWTNTTVQRLRNLGKDITYHIYPGADHNLRPDWDTVVQRDLDFFNEHLR